MYIFECMNISFYIYIDIHTYIYAYRVLARALSIFAEGGSPTEVKVYLYI